MRPILLWKNSVRSYQIHMTLDDSQFKEQKLVMGGQIMLANVNET